jgi:hypothetical protein
MRLNKIFKWVSVFVTIFAALTISLKLTPMLISYTLFLSGHLPMLIILMKDKDWSLATMNLIWVIIDILGIIIWM